MNGTQWMTSMCAAGVVIAAMSGRADAETVANFRDGLQPGAPASGWSFLWNQSEPIGNTGSYVAMGTDSATKFLYDAGGDGVGEQGIARYAIVGTYDNFPMTDTWDRVVHPGAVQGQNGAAFDVYTILAYQVGDAGLYKLTDSVVSHVDGRSNGVEILVFAGDSATPATSTVTNGQTDSNGQLMTWSFDTELGFLNAGEMIYVAIGGSGSGSSKPNRDFFDTVVIDYSIGSIQVVPEPLAAAGFVGVAGFALRRTRRWL